MFAERYMLNPKRREIIAKDTSIKRLIVNDKQKCLTCPKSLRLISGKLVRFPKLQDRAKKYQHDSNCTQKERF